MGSNRPRPPLQGDRPSGRCTSASAAPGPGAAPAPGCRQGSPGGGRHPALPGPTRPDPQGRRRPQAKPPPEPPPPPARVHRATGQRLPGARNAGGLCHRCGTVLLPSPAPPSRGRGGRAGLPSVLPARSWGRPARRGPRHLDLGTHPAAPVSSVLDLHLAGKQKKTRKGHLMHRR